LSYRSIILLEEVTADDLPDREGLVERANLFLETTVWWIW
jgi:hypothetical protein